MSSAYLIAESSTQSLCTQQCFSNATALIPTLLVFSPVHWPCSQSVGLILRPMASFPDQWPRSQTNGLSPRPVASFSDQWPQSQTNGLVLRAKPVPTIINISFYSHLPTLSRSSIFIFSPFHLQSYFKI